MPSKVLVSGSCLQGTDLLSSGYNVTFLNARATVSQPSANGWITKPEIKYFNQPFMAYQSSGAADPYFPKDYPNPGIIAKSSDKKIVVQDLTPNEMGSYC